MIYDSLGNMAAQVMPNRVRRKYAAAEPTPDEAKDAITGYLAYFGTYSVHEQARTVTHHRKGNINPDRLILTPAGSLSRMRLRGGATEDQAVAAVKLEQYAKLPSYPAQREVVVRRMYKELTGNLP